MQPSSSTAVGPDPDLALDSGRTGSGSGTRQWSTAVGPDELRTQLVDLLLDRGRAGSGTRPGRHAAAAVLARKPDGPRRIGCDDYRGLNAVTRPARWARPSSRRPAPHIDAPLDGARGSRFFRVTKPDLASSPHQLRGVRAADR